MPETRTRTSADASTRTYALARDGALEVQEAEQRAPALSTALPYQPLPVQQAVRDHGVGGGPQLAVVEGGVGHLEDRHVQPMRLGEGRQYDGAQLLRVAWGQGVDVFPVPGGPKMMYGSGAAGQEEERVEVAGGAAALATSSSVSAAAQEATTARTTCGPAGSVGAAGQASNVFRCKHARAAASHAPKSNMMRPRMTPRKRGDSTTSMPYDAPCPSSTAAGPTADAVTP
ncbi:hypothetical protein TSOC_001849 [Tetrabaena socialis]|uniref:Uncharacterized protein n=1 Tax=Tetrabaena socialis TaxID=47790 RepID=A0A2J8AFL7_9CHLO|nr:hypothetical protein TSOC_001849 [Tetrabaena socialis]|eukprot:PNH11315.1 hypothetical protein TSOC_001849 [Tetrabaena socialis]